MLSFNLLAIIFIKSLQSELIRAIGLQFLIYCLLSDFFGIRVKEEIFQDSGIKAFDKILLKVLSRCDIKSCCFSLYSSYGIPSGPGAFPFGNLLMTRTNSFFIIRAISLLLLKVEIYGKLLRK